MQKEKTISQIFKAAVSPNICQSSTNMWKKKCSASLVIKEMQISMRNIFTQQIGKFISPLRLVLKAGERAGKEIGILIYWR